MTSINPHTHAMVTAPKQHKQTDDEKHAYALERFRQIKAEYEAQRPRTKRLEIHELPVRRNTYHRTEKHQRSKLFRLCQHKAQASRKLYRSEYSNS